MTLTLLKFSIDIVLESTEKRNIQLLVEMQESKIELNKRAVRYRSNIYRCLKS